MCTAKSELDFTVKLLDLFDGVFSYSHSRFYTTSLYKELSTLTNPQSFAVYLGIPQDKLEIISQDYQCGMSIIIIHALECKYYYHASKL